MAKVYAPPASLGNPPDFDAFKGPNGYDFRAHQIAEDAWVATIQAAAKVANPRCNISGEIVRFGVGDGNAVYVIWNATTLIHCAVGDNWHIPDAHARGLRAADLRAMVQGDKELAKLFGKSKFAKKGD